ncbi:hypothetical protein QJS04_geneDACA004928 [Acorus gramineus]|uniref:Glucan endo-1,3-beta-D-glucosidase n=1 Tax=Acorus gramineus TaxID=55184 RepID=A0AAV9BUX8_ACOGR|nr:hypothetical protein QJS04_geneDACA004928 [Acorus gramineus]
MELFMILNFMLVLVVGVSEITFAAPPRPTGINYGLLGDNLPTPTDAVALVKRCGMSKVRLFEPKPEVLQALRGSGLGVSLGIRNEDLSTLASSTDAARTWLTTNYYPYIPDLNVLYITAGNEVIPGSNAQYVVPALKNIQSVLTQDKKTGVLPTTVVSGAVFQDTYPPSGATFTSEALPIMTDLITFLKGAGFPLLVNIYPYFAYAANPSAISLDFALLQPNATGFMDGSLKYTNLFDAMYDAAVWAVEKAGGEGLNVYVSETGWPSGGNGAGTTPENAAAYVNNFYKLNMNGPGSPKRPNASPDAYVFALFNENQKPAGVEQNFGVFYPSMKSVYSNPWCPSG